MLFRSGFDAKALENGFTKKDGTPIPNNSTFHITYNDAQLLGIQSQIVEKMRNLIMLPAGRDLKNAAINVYMAELESGSRRGSTAGGLANSVPKARSCGRGD